MSHKRALSVENYTFVDPLYENVYILIKRCLYIEKVS